VSPKQRTLWGLCVGALVVAGFAAPARATTGPWSGDHFLARGAASAQIHVNRSGAAVASWTSDLGGKQPGRAFVATKDAGGRWSPPHALSAPGTSVPNIWSGIGDAGRSVVVWTVGRHTYWAQRASRRSWSVAHTVRGLGENLPQSFDMSLSGNAVIGFPANRHAYVQMLTPAGIWRPRVALSTKTTRYGADHVAAVISADSTITAAWLQITQSGENGTFGKWQRGTIRPNGTRGAVHTLARHVIGGPGITRSTTGNAIAIYESYTGTPHTLAFRLRDGRWHTWTAPSPGNAYDVTAALTGTRMAVWWTTAAHAAGTKIYVADYVQGHWSDPVIVHHEPTGPDEAGGLGLVAAMSSGQRLVAWTDGDEGAARYPHATVLRDWRNGTLAQYRWGARSTVASVSAAGGHAAFAWLGGPSRSGLRVRTR
jgi:hypothetical protein